jgi:23S rRNA (adenine-N6)-dimethyltransferase
VVEVGGGRGALTKLLCERAGHLIAVEIDPHLATRLRREFSGRADIVESDFLALELPRDAYCLIGNIPYALSTEILRKIVEAPNPPTDAWLVVQREFGERLCGHPFGKESLWSHRLKPFWHVEIIDRLATKEFTPPPSVESVFLQLGLRARSIIREEEASAYDQLLHVGFGRPTLSQSLKPLLSKIQLRRLASDYCFGVDDAPGSLMFEQWLGIFRFLQRINKAK